MKFIATPCAGLTIVELNPITDARGFFSRAWCAKEFTDAGLSNQLSQANISFNVARGTVRGLHYQIAPHAEAKLVRCIQGAIFDVAVDLRPESLTYRKWFGIELSAQNRKALYIPEGFAHGYQTLTDNAELFYQVSTAYHAASERGVRFDDPAIGIQWPLAAQCLSPKDLSYVQLQISDLAS
jgi:dTDP-4-dehydrorhamnose 3,5-epimerase